MEFGSLDGGDDGKHNADFVEISKIFATQNAIFYGAEPFWTDFTPPLIQVIAAHHLIN